VDDRRRCGLARIVRRHSSAPGLPAAPLVVARPLDPVRWLARRPERSYPRAVKINMSNDARKRPSTVRHAS
jgi:hypothetical protein